MPDIIWKQNCFGDRWTATVPGGVIYRTLFPLGGYLYGAWTRTPDGKNDDKLVFSGSSLSRAMFALADVDTSGKHE